MDQKSRYRVLINGPTGPDLATQGSKKVSTMLGEVLIGFKNINALEIKETNIWPIKRIFVLIFVPTTILSLLYYIVGYFQQVIPSILFFFVLALFILLPFELGVILITSKKDFGKYSLKSSFALHEKSKVGITITIASILFLIAGIFSITIGSIENNLTSELRDKLFCIISPYFDWTNLLVLNNYSKNILIATCILYFIGNGFILPIIEELYFRGLLTSKVKQLGNWAPILITVLFSFYHFWAPFNNIFRIFAFFPAAYIAWKEKNIYISILFHCFCNIFSTVSIIISILIYF